MPQPYIDFAFVKENASFERVIAGYSLKLLGSGPQRTILCPFHRERKPSCKVNLVKGAFHCFGCQAKGNVLEFVARLEGSPGDLRAAAIKIAALCGIATAPPRDNAPPRVTATHIAKGRDERPKLAGGDARTASEQGERRRPSGIAPVSAEPAGRATEAAGAEPINPPLTFALKLDPSHPYLAERGLSAEQVALFGLGLCNRGVMGGRICIPVHDERGHLVAYAGRWPGEEPPHDEEKYKLPRHFQKSRVLFNLHRVEDDAEHVVLVEGYWSAFRLHSLGVAVVALMGNSVSPEQIALLRERGTRFVTLLLDGDDAGRQARDRALPALVNAFFVSAPLLAEGEKPDAIEETQLLDLVGSPIW